MGVPDRACPSSTFGVWHSLHPRLFDRARRMDRCFVGRQLRSERSRSFGTVRRLVGVVGSALLLAAGGNAITAPPNSRADDPVTHHVKYSVWTESPATAEIYYRDTDPPTFADYSHNPYLYSPKIMADVGPDKRWVLDVMLAEPDQWAMVIGTIRRAQTASNFHCVLAVDGSVVVINSGPKGALCSIRDW